MHAALCEPSDHAIKRYEHSPWNAPSSPSSEDVRGTYLRYCVVGVSSLRVAESSASALDDSEDAVLEPPMQSHDDSCAARCSSWQTLAVVLRGPSASGALPRRNQGYASSSFVRRERSRASSRRTFRSTRIRNVTHLFLAHDRRTRPSRTAVEGTFSALCQSFQ